MSKWVSPEERLPGKLEKSGFSVDVLCCLERRDGETYYYDMFVGYYYYEEGVWYTEMHNGCAQVGITKFGNIIQEEDEKVVAWRPLPKWPKGICR